jgi:hypothetical protein
MATLTAIKGRMQTIYENRYGNSVWIAWINELLEELAGAGFLMPTLDKETGHVVVDDVWITKPSGLRVINKICHPEYPDMEFLYKEVEDKIKLLNAVVDSNDDPDTASNFQNYLVGSMEIDIDDAAEDDFEEYLLVIDGGTSSGDTIIIRNNDAAAAGYTKVYFRHDLSAALDGTKITSCYLVSTDYYVLMEWSGSYTDVSAVGDEVPIDDKYEKRITKAYFDWKVRQRASRFSKDSLEAEKQYNVVLNKIKNELRSSVGTQIRPRQSPGYDQYSETGDYFEKKWANPRNP